MKTDLRKINPSDENQFLKASTIYLGVKVLNHIKTDSYLEFVGVSRFVFWSPLSVFHFISLIYGNFRSFSIYFYLRSQCLLRVSNVLILLHKRMTYYIKHITM